jgi:hypothetical protein
VQEALGCQNMSDQAPQLGNSMADPARSADTYSVAAVFGSDPMGPTRYQRCSASLPHLEDQPDVGVSRSDLPSPVASHLRPLERLRDLISN